MINTMETKSTGYKIKQYPFETKRYCQTLDLEEDNGLIAEYIKKHTQEEFPPIVLEEMKRAGILDMEIYILDNRLFMIVEAPIDFDWDKTFTQLASLPNQQEWEKEVSVFQKAKEGASSSEKWQLMDKIFRLY